MLNDDQQTGLILSRRQALQMLSMAGMSVAVRCAYAADTGVPSCVVRPEMTTGPYFLDQQLNRSDIRSEPSDGSIIPGVPLSLAINVFQFNNGCLPLADAVVDIWQCDTQGVYSGVDDNTLGFHTIGKKFLRGYQVTDKDGRAQFSTIFPGWYTGRTVHIHLKIRTRSITGGAYEFTSQLYVDDELTNKIHSTALYRRDRQRDTTNSNDMHYRNGGSQLLLKPLELANGALAANFVIGLDLADDSIGAADGGMRGPEGMGARRGRVSSGS